MSESNVEFVEEIDAEINPSEIEHFSEAVLHSADWTVETIVAQLTRENIEMNPRFQRRDAWSVRRKSIFIESLIMGLPVPQIVLAEKKGQRGKYIVLDGKQRLLSLLQFTGNATGENNSFRLTGLEARSDLTRKNFSALNAPELENDLNAFLNYTVRTVVIRNWPSFEFLHLVFLRLNTGSVKLSPQELRQAMFPGEFSNLVDDQAGNSMPLRQLLGTDSPDPRMRDVELLVRYLGFHFFLSDYRGRMKEFLDQACERLNADWDIQRPAVINAIEGFNAALELLLKLFGDGVARKSNSKSFNRGIFDALIFYASNSAIRDVMTKNIEAVKGAYLKSISDEKFLRTTESDTSSVTNTTTRLLILGENLKEVLNINFILPEVIDVEQAGQSTGSKIIFNGFGI